LIEQGNFKRADLWTKAFAVGNEEWVKKHLKQAGIKRMTVRQSNGIYFARGEND